MSSFKVYHLAEHTRGPNHTLVQQSDKDQAGHHGRHHRPRHNGEACEARVGDAAAPGDDCALPLLGIVLDLVGHHQVRPAVGRLPLPPGTEVPTGTLAPRGRGLRRGDGSRHRLRSSVLGLLLLVNVDGDGGLDPIDPAVLGPDVVEVASLHDALHPALPPRAVREDGGERPAVGFLLKRRKD